MSSLPYFITQNTISDTAQVKYHEGHKAPPTMLPGCVTPALLLQWEEHVITYFDKAKTPEADKVSSVLTCWRDSEIDNFIKMHKPCFCAPNFTFPLFMAEIHKCFLDPLWHNNIMRNVVNSKMDQSESLSKFANLVIAGNNLLEGMGIHLDTANLHKTLLGNMSEFLASKLDRLHTAECEQLATVESFEEWMAEIFLINHEATSDLKHIAEMLREDSSFKCQCLDDPSLHPPAPTPFHPSNAPNLPTPLYRGTSVNAICPPSFPPPVQIAFPQNTSTRKRCPPLSQTEISLLNKHKECRKCQQFYISHRGSDCPYDFPNGATYVPLTEDAAFEAMRKLAIASTYNGSSSSNKISNTRTCGPSPIPSSSSFSNAYNNYFAPPTITYSTPAPSVIENSSLQIKEVSSTPSDNFAPSSSAIAAILLSSFQPFNLGIDSDTSGSTEDVSPISVPHLIWKAQVWNNDEVQIPFDCLLNDGAHLVLIRPETVTDLGLPRHCLSKPVSITLALSSMSPSVTELWNYVSLSLSSLNNAWSPHPVCALIAPGLCSNILLGLPFLSHNKIVIDHNSHTAIDKTCGFELLNESTSCRHAPPPSLNLSPLQKWLLILKQKKFLLAELKLKCSEHLASLETKGLFKMIKPLNLINVITDKIASLASQKKLTKKELDIKKEYKDVFCPISHISELPTSETACIQLKNAYEVISKRQYNIPHQFHENFAKLIQQCLDTSFIQPSSSSYMSPSFIIPKADPTALLRWVCDYRQFNANTVLDNFTLPRVDDILADCAKGKIWVTIDMNDSFFQTHMHLNDIHKTAVTTPFGNYEWCMMLMGFRNSPAIHQRRVTNTLRKHISKICHIYLDDIVIWSDNIEEHIKNVKTILEALRTAKLYVNK